jgi:hypothetical protein
MPASDFFASLRKMLELSTHALLTDQLPTAKDHNEGARILRHGLAVSAFSSLEKYIEDCVDQTIATIAGGALNYSLFGNSLKELLTIQAIGGLNNRIRFEEPADRQAMAERNIKLIASYDSTPPTYSSLGLRPGGSNLSHKQITATLKALGVKDPWGRLSQITSSVGVSRLDLAGDYRTLSKTRNSSAHNPIGNIPTSDLETHIQNSILIAIATDVFCKKIGYAYAAFKTTSDVEDHIKNGALILRFVDEQSDGSWHERSGLAAHATKIYPTEIDAVAGALSRKIGARVVVRNRKQVPIEVH